MSSLFSRSTSDILNEALLKLSNSTAITSTSPGSVAQAFTQAIATELGDFYSILDFNMSQFNLSTASGSSLDMIGALYNVQRKSLSDLTVIDRSLGAFYFYINAPYYQNITIPAGTRIYTNNTTYVGQQFTYATTEDFTILTGRTKVYASILPQFTNSVYTAGANTLTVMDPNFTQPVGAMVLCTNPKAIQAQVGSEDDTSYAYRIQQAVRTAAGGTLTAVRLGGISVAGVRDVAIRDTPYGLGSFEALVTPEDYTQSANILASATTAMLALKPVGVRMYVGLPTFLPVDVDCSIVMGTGLNIDTNTTINAVQVAIVRFLNQPLVGSTLVYSQLIQTILDADNAVLDVTINNLAVNNIQVLFQNYTPASNSQLVPGTVTVTAATS